MEMVNTLNVCGLTDEDAATLERPVELFREQTKGTETPQVEDMPERSPAERGVHIGARPSNQLRQINFHRLQGRQGYV
jgi:hypothetical protein